MANLIDKYKITERDLYSLSLINSKKQSVGLLEKEKLKAASLSILKPYKVQFFELGLLIKEIGKTNYHIILSGNFTDDEKTIIEKEISTKSDVARFYNSWLVNISKKKKFIYGSILLLLILGIILPKSEQKGDINQELTNRFSGEYLGTESQGGVIVTWEVSVDPLKYEGDKTYTSYVTGTARDNFGGLVSLQKSKFIIKIDENLNPIQFCFKDQYGSSLLGGNPCAIKHESNSFVVLERGFTIARINNRFHDWTKRNND